MLHRMSARKFFGFILLFTMILLASFSFVHAQYVTETTTSISIPDSSKLKTTSPEIGVTYEIIGAPGANGSVTTSVYNGNPQATAKLPASISFDALHCSYF
jgi:hypothetical protein